MTVGQLLSRELSSPEGLHLALRDDKAGVCAFFQQPLAEELSWQRGPSVTCQAALAVTAIISSLAGTLRRSLQDDGKSTPLSS